MEYAGYKNYVCTRRLELADKMSGLKKNIKSRLASSHKKRKEIKRQLKVIQEKRQSPLTVDDLLSNSIIEVLYQISGNCYYYIY